MYIAVPLKNSRRGSFNEILEEGHHSFFPGTLPGGLGFFLLALHGALEPCHVQIDAGITGHFLGQIDGKPVGVIEFENFFPR